MKKEITSLPGYSVDTEGNVYSKLFPNRVMYTAINSTGYPNVMIKVNGKLKGFRPHRLLAMTFIPNPDNKPCVNHKDNDRTNNKVDNLEWVTHKENTAHAVAQGRIIYPEPRRRALGNHAKLTENQVTTIRQLKSQGETNVAIAKQFDVHHSTIARISNNQTWIEETA